MKRDLRFRMTPSSYGITDPQAQIDPGAGIIRGVSAIQAVEALGHGMTADAKTLQQCADAINAAPGGVKSRFTHPGMCSDALGKMLGRATNASVIGDKCICDLQLSESSKVSPDGNLWAYVMARAQEDPASFGLSIAFTGSAVWMLDDGSEVDEEMDDGSARERPSNAVGDLPRARIAALKAVDVVDEPAANRDGLFSATNSLADDAFHTIDQFSQEKGITTERLSQFACRYFAARGVNLSVVKPAVATSPAIILKGKSMKPEELKALRDKHPDHAGLIVDMFADSKTEVEILAAIEKKQQVMLSEKVDLLIAKIAKQEADHKSALSASADQITALKADLDKANKVAALGTGAPAPIGGLEGSEVEGMSDLDKQWSADPELRKRFGDDKDSFVALSNLESEQESIRLGKGKSLFQPVNAANVTKKEGVK